MKTIHLLILILLGLLMNGCNNDDSYESEQMFQEEFPDRCVLSGNPQNPVVIEETRVFSTGNEEGLSVLWEVSGEIELLNPVDSRVMKIKFNKDFTTGKLSVKITGDNLSCISEINFTK